MASEFISVEDRLWSGAVEDENGCWVWQRSITTSGYGQISVFGTRKAIHRVAYELAIGPIPEGLVIDHLCRNRVCINPDHLEPVSFKENVLRGTAGSAKNARKTTCSKGHDITDPANLLSEGSRNWRACRVCHYDRQRRYREQRTEARLRALLEDSQEEGR